MTSLSEEVGFTECCLSRMARHNATPYGLYSQTKRSKGRMKSDMNFLRFLTLAVVVAMVLSVSVSCGGGDEDSSDAGAAATQP